MWIKQFNTIEEALTFKQDNHAQIVKHQDQYEFYTLSDVQEDSTYVPYNGFPYTNYAQSLESHALRGLSITKTQELPVYSIDYKVALQSGVRLVPYYTISADGLLVATNYYLEGTYEIGIAYKRPVIKITESYQYHEADAALNPSERSIVSREKTWQYYKENGELDTSLAHTKTKRKVYQTNQQFLEVGKRRRYNIKSVYSEKIGALLVILGIFADDAYSTARQKANDELRKFSKAHSVDFLEYENYATKDIYDAISNDAVFAWLDTYVPTQTEMENNLLAQGLDAATAATNAGLYQGAISAYAVTAAQGGTLRDYSLEKLKGNVL